MMTEDELTQEIDELWNDLNPDDANTPDGIDQDSSGNVTLNERGHALLLAFARRMQAVGLREAGEKAAKNVYMSEEADLPGHFGGPASCEYGCGSALADWCEAEATKREKP